MIVLEELAGVDRVADRGLLGDSEHGRQMQRVGAADERFVELPVDAQPFQVRGQAAQVQDERRADRAEPKRAFLADQQMRVGSVRPSAASVVEPFGQRAVGRLVERACPHDRWSTDAHAHAVAVRRYATEIDPLDWAASEDWMTENHVLARRHHGQRMPSTWWIWSDVWAHPPVVEEDTFTAAQRKHRATAWPLTRNEPPGRAA